MAVYTHVGAEALAAFLTRYDLGALVSHTGVREGVENTNYIVKTERGRFVLTLFEKRVAEEDLPYFLDLTAHIAARGVPAPAPVADREGRVLQRLMERPAVIISFLEGRPRMTPSEGECRAAGEILARLHLAGADFEGRRENALGLSGWRDLARRCGADAERCAPALPGLIESELETLGRGWPKDLPEGQIHADLFPDNAFFQGEALTGLIDFYFACTDYYAYDLAVTLNSWCWQSRQWRAGHAAAMLAGYEAMRPLSAEEKNALPLLQRGAALRFLLTRLYDWLNQEPGALVTVKDPLEFRDLLLFLRDASPESLYGARL